MGEHEFIYIVYSDSDDSLCTKFKSEEEAIEVAKAYKNRDAYVVKAEIEKDDLGKVITEHDRYVI